MWHVFCDTREASTDTYVCNARRDGPCACRREGESREGGTGNWQPQRVFESRGSQGEGGGYGKGKTSEGGKGGGTGKGDISKGGSSARVDHRCEAMIEAMYNQPQRMMVVLVAAERHAEGGCCGGAAEAAAAAPRSESFAHVSRDFALGYVVHMYVRRVSCE